jgi:hypothetical protein
MKQIYLNALGALLVIVFFATSLGFLVRGTSEPSKYSDQPHVWKPVVVKKKYSEQSVTKDLVFGTGNWHDIEHYIVDTNGKLWNGISKEDYIICEVGDTLWTDNDWSLQIKK